MAKERSFISARVSRPSACATLGLRSGIAGRRGRQREGVETQHHGNDRADLQRNVGGLDGIAQACSARCRPTTNPTTIQPKRAAGAHQSELLARVAHLVERDGIGQAQRGHEADGVDQQRPEERGRIGDARQPPQDDRAHQVQHAHDLLRLEKAVGQRTGNDGREYRAPVQRAVGGAHLQAIEADLEQVGAEGDEPRTPQRELQEHHHGQPQPDVRIHVLSPMAQRQRSRYARKLTGIRGDNNMGKLTHAIFMAAAAWAVVTAATRAGTDHHQCAHHRARWHGDRKRFDCRAGWKDRVGCRRRTRDEGRQSHRCQGHERHGRVHRCPSAYQRARARRRKCSGCWKPDSRQCCPVAARRSHWCNCAQDIDSGVINGPRIIPSGGAFPLGTGHGRNRSRGDPQAGATGREVHG